MGLRTSPSWMEVTIRTRSTKCVGISKASMLSYGELSLNVLSSLEKTFSLMRTEEILIVMHKLKIFSVIA